jgi:CRP/FNR family cyclic AMP-dependent transcriptional regulator
MSHPNWDLFDGLTAEQVSQVLSLASPKLFQQGKELFYLGEEAGELFLVVSGKVRLTLPLTVGNRELDVMVGESMSGNMLGWSGLIPPHRFTVKGVAMAETEVLSFPRPSLLAFLAENPVVGYAVMSNLARIVGQRLQVFQTMWIREMQHVVKSKTA